MAFACADSPSWQEDSNLADLVRRSAARRPDATALVHDGARTTWSDLDAAVDAAAASLVSELGLTTGDRVALCLSNTPDFVTAYFATLRAGLVVVPINTGYTSREMSHLLGEADARVVIAEEATLPTVRDAVDTAERTVVDVPGFRDLVETGRSGERSSRWPAARTSLCCSSPRAPADGPKGRC